MTAEVDLQAITKAAVSRAQKARWKRHSAPKDSSEWSKEKYQHKQGSQFPGIIKHVLGREDAPEGKYDDANLPYWTKALRAAHKDGYKHRLKLTLQKAKLNRKFRSSYYKLPPGHPLREEDGLTLDAFKALKAVYQSLPVKTRYHVNYKAYRTYLESKEPEFREALEDWRKHKRTRNGSH